MVMTPGGNRPHPLDSGVLSVVPRSELQDKMVKLDVTCLRHLSKNDIRVLTAVEVSFAYLISNQAMRHSVTPAAWLTLKVATGF